VFGVASTIVQWDHYVAYVYTRAKCLPDPQQQQQQHTADSGKIQLISTRGKTVPLPRSGAVDT